jgi:hypothetical protein
LQDLAHLLASQRRLTELTIQEVHELEELDTLDPASLWDVLAAATPVLAGRLQVGLEPGARVGAGGSNKVQELDGCDALDPTSLWGVLAAATPVVAG